MLDRDGARSSEAHAVLAGHLAACGACREAHASAIAAEGLLAAWPDIPIEPMHKSACLSRLTQLAHGRSRLTSWRATQTRWVVRLALVGLVVALAFGLGPVGRGICGPGAAIAWAFSAVERWCAEGTATPPLLKGPASRVCNHVRIWYEQPDSLRILVDDGPDGPLYELTKHGGETKVRDPYGLVGHGLVDEAGKLDVDELFAVRDWLAAKSILRAPVEDLGLEIFGGRTVRRIKITPTGGWLAGGGTHGPQPIMLRVDEETMLPLLLETTTHGSTIILDFQYDTDFPSP